MLYQNGARMEKNTTKYSFLSNLLYHYRNLLKWEPLMFWAGILSPIPAFIKDIAGNYLPSLMVKGLEEKWDLPKYILYMAVVLAVMLIFQLLASASLTYSDEGRTFYARHYMRAFEEKRMRVDYEVLESKEFQNRSNIAYTAIYTGRGITEAVYNLPNVISLLVPTVVYAVILARVSLWIILLLAICTFVSIKLLKLARTKHSEAHSVLADYSKKLNYLTGKSMEPAAGKDIRIYKMASWLNKTYAKDLEGMNKTYYGVHNWYCVKNATEAFLRAGSGLLVYGYLVYMVVEGQLSLADFVFYFGLVNSFIGLSFQCFRQALSLGIIGNTFGSIREYFDTEERRNGDNKLDESELEEIKKNAVTLELRNVSFTYEGANKPVISNMNLKLNAGEKLALIGLNGAGKTTLVKLICGFYAPTEGEILLNGIPIEEFSREQYYSLISVLFQDYTVLPVTVDENIASCGKEKLKADRLNDSLIQSGFKERYDRLAKGGDSLLVKDINTEAVDFSGGEKQRLLFARALYKDAPLLILDEPTAALDPIAENEIYMKYGEVTKGKTSIYISHRLSSTRFCDRIVLLENGNIVESGTHNELMTKNGRYAELYELQSQYYRDEADKKRREAYMEGEV